ncbi:MAG: ferritin-like domain-containing protein [Candidatus Synoicihabitans palmerolidicus]|nr:ferritin-like domain-containing protein [Candidatus Synoicihabitans palmerolidicus]
MKLEHPNLVKSLRKAYSAEKAAAYAYIGHAKSLGDPVKRAAVRRIERDEWDHRWQVGEILRRYDIPVSTTYELLYAVIGRTISASCHVIGRFMLYFLPENSRVETSVSTS